MERYKHNLIFQMTCILYLQNKTLFFLDKLIIYKAKLTELQYDITLPVLSNQFFKTKYNKSLLFHSKNTTQECTRYYR